MSTDPYDFDPADTGGAYLGAGVHDPVYVTDHELCEASTGTPQIAVTFESPRGTHREFFALTEKARWRLAALFGACGWTTRIRLSDPGMVKKAIYKKPVRLVLVAEEYGGKTRAKADPSGFAPGRGGPVAPSDEPPPRDEAPFPGDDDKIPF